jgi:Flp pilus assembly protein TadD
VSAEAQKRLRSLGYAASSATAPSAATGRNPATAIAAWTRFEDALAALNAHRPDAVPKLARLVTDEPDAPVFRATYARALKENGRLADALDVYRRAAKRWPTDAMLLHDLAVAARDASLRASGSVAAALRQEATNADLAALTVAPSSASAHNGLGLLAIDQERPADAAREFERASALDPNNASYWINLGNARRGNGDSAGAEQAYRRALDVDSQSVDAANGVGVLLVEAKRPAESVAWFERALSAAPDFVEARLNLAIALQQAGNNARAAETYRAVLDAHGPHPREKDAARKLLAAMSGTK